MVLERKAAGPFPLVFELLLGLSVPSSKCRALEADTAARALTADSQLSSIVQHRHWLFALRFSLSLPPQLSTLRASDRNKYMFWHGKRQIIIEACRENNREVNWPIIHEL